MAALAAERPGSYRPYVFLGHGKRDLLDDLLKQTNSDRFHAVAHFFLGLRHFPQNRPAGGRDPLVKAAGHFDACATTRGTSDGLKALAMYFAMRCRAEEVMWTPREQTFEAAYRVIDAFPGTCGAHKSELFLASLGAPARSSRSGRFWLRRRDELAAGAGGLTCLVVLYALYRWRVRAGRLARAACPKCGYDLGGSANSGRCPECNTSTFPPAAGPTGTYGRGQAPA
jgi:hypothetical protein